jgi:phosphoribosylformylglycinamidine synthase
VVGTTFDELGGSVYLENLGQLGMNGPKVNFKIASKIYKAFEKARQAQIIASAHDCSEGGLAVALAEMAFAGGLGATALLQKLPYKGQRRQDDVLLFSESNSRFIVEVAPAHEGKLARIFKGLPLAKIGTVEASP